MHLIVNESNVYTKLRDKAEAQLLSGTTNPSGQWSMGIDALQLLHRLSSNPDQAQDALKLLHELQVHQVELDLQNEEIAANERAREEELNHYRTLYDSAPLAYCVLDLEGTVVQSNLSAAELFAPDQDGIEGQPIDAFLQPHDRPLLLALLRGVADSGKKDSCLTERVDGEQGSGPLQFFASISPEREHILLVCYECKNLE